jgi:uncharacterized Zn-binding protein involved in type VI secretion
MPPAARLGDLHSCPLSQGGVPHIGGAILEGCAGVRIDGMPAAVVGSSCACAGPPDTVAAGSSSVFIGGRPAARVGDATAHGGIIVAGSAIVVVGG